MHLKTNACETEMENMRSGILRKRKIASAVFFLTLNVLTGLTGTASAQNTPEAIVSLVEEYGEELTESSLEELIEKYERFAEDPLCINDCTREDLEELGLLSLFQIESIMDYRRQYGEILSAGELMVVDGFNQEMVSKLIPFITFDNEYSIGETSRKRTPDTEITAKGKKKWASEGIGLTGKINSGYGRHSIGLIADHDASERLTGHHLPDFVSMHYQYSGDKFQFVVGDYTARFGQGLTLWKAFPMSFLGAPSSVAKRGKGISGYNSTDEDNYLRGLAASIGIGKGTLSVLGSFKKIDARVEGIYYTSLVTGGIHASESELAKRHTMKELLGGINYTLRLPTLKLGLSAVTYIYDKHNGRKVADYNRYQIYDGLWGNIGLDFYGFWNRFRYFGEVSSDAHFAPALIAGVIWGPKYEFEMSLTCRYYDKSYIATHSGAYSSLSSTSNQSGLTCSIKWIAANNLTINGNADCVRYPWSRFKISGASYSIKARLSADYEKQNNMKISARVSVSMNGTANQNPELLPKGTLTGWYQILPELQVEGALSGNRGGYAAFAELNYKNRKFQLSARATRYQTATWDDRIYFYEKGMPQTYSVEAFYGTGWSGYIMLKYSPNRIFKIYLKVSDRYCAFLTRITIPG